MMELKEDSLFDESFFENVLAMDAEWKKIVAPTRKCECVESSISFTRVESVAFSLLVRQNVTLYAYLQHHTS